MKVSKALIKAVHTQLIGMATRGELDGDISQIDMEGVFDKAIDSVSNEDKEVDRLLEYTSGSSDMSGWEARRVLLKVHSQGKGDEMADDHVDMSEVHEFRYTVSQLLDEILIHEI